jgi:hypothetical protein
MPPVVAAVPGMLHERTRAWADAHGARVAWLAADAEAYWRLLADEWAASGDLVLVEHDIEPAPDVTAAMAACPRPWCGSPYRIAHCWLNEGLGCVKLSARLKARHPDLMTRLGEITGDGLPERDWHRLDVRLARLLRHLGYTPHTHRRSLHLHDYGARP